MRVVSSVALSLIFAVAPSHAASGDKLAPDRPSAMTSTEIAAFNEGLAKNDPNYITCRKQMKTGSLVRKARVCHSNAQWREVSATGNQAARDEINRMTPQGTNGN